MPPKLALDKLLKKKRISKRQFAKMLDMRYEHVFRLFRKGYNPTFNTMVTWTKLLKCKVRDFIKE